MEYEEMSKTLSKQIDQSFPEFEIIDTNNDNKIILKEIIFGVLTQKGSQDDDQTKHQNER